MGCDNPSVGEVALATAGESPALQNCLSRNKRIPGDDIPKRLFCGLGNPDANRGSDLLRLPSVVGNLKVGPSRCNVFVIVAVASDGEGFRQAARSGGEKAKLGQAAMFRFEVAGGIHQVDADDRFKGADEQASGVTVWFARNIEAVVKSVNEINVSVAGRSEEHGVTSGQSAIGVSGGIVESEVGFHFDDARGTNLFTFPAHE